MLRVDHRHLAPGRASQLAKEIPADYVNPSEPRFLEPFNMESPSYYLAKHVFYCLADHHYVFLDLRNDQYLCLRRKETDATTHLLDASRVLESNSARVCPRSIDEGEVRAVVQSLVEKGLLIEDKAFGKPPLPECAPIPSSSTMDERNRSRPPIGPADVWNFLIAAASASMHLKSDSIEKIVQRVASRKMTGHPTDSAIDIEAVTKLFEIFHALRPYYPRPYLCVFDSLALLHFLARYRVFPLWVYGVKLEPFAAHCWVQQGDSVINDSLTNVTTYTPIMSI